MKIKSWAIALMSAAVVLTSAVSFPSDIKTGSPSDMHEEKSLLTDVGKSLADVNGEIAASVFNLPKVYVLPMGMTVPPKPDPANYDGDTYSDETITVRCWRETQKVGGSFVVINFADVKIAHPTQLRTAFAGRNYTATRRAYTTRMAAENNAVLAINGDYCNIRPTGLIIRQGILYRDTPMGIDTLFIDSEGNFSTMDDQEAKDCGYYTKNSIYQALPFGPTLVRDGKAIQIEKDFNSVACGAYAKNPRTAIGQLGELHYLVCVVNGRQTGSAGCTTNDLAKMMAEKGCITAFNLDGGQSSAMVFKNRLYNKVCNGGERQVSDIVYFATALPEGEK